MASGDKCRSTNRRGPSHERRDRRSKAGSLRNQMVNFDSFALDRQAAEARPPMADRLLLKDQNILMIIPTPLDVTATRDGGILLKVGMNDRWQSKCDAVVNFAGIGGKGPARLGERLHGIIHALLIHIFELDLLEMRCIASLQSDERYSAGGQYAKRGTTPHGIDARVGE